jgi:hypothetical protein
MRRGEARGERRERFIPFIPAHSSDLYPIVYSASRAFSIDQLLRIFWSFSVWNINIKKAHHLGFLDDMVMRISPPLRGDMYHYYLSLLLSGTHGFAQPKCPKREFQHQHQHQQHL